MLSMLPNACHDTALRACLASRNLNLTPSMKLLELVWHPCKTGKLMSVQGLICIPKIKDLKTVIQNQREQETNIMKNPQSNTIKRVKV